MHLAGGRRAPSSPSYLRHRVAEDKIEGEANAFAAELVIPRAELPVATATTRPTLEALRRQFGASRQAMVYALLDAGVLDPVASRGS